ncbi:MAG: MerR family transcriptional regulator, partial [Deltaproteobacteria bacterium]|nr:MerR family transcriptional regulator [Deltaproteobacteria bacterium]
MSPKGSDNGSRGASGRSPRSYSGRSESKLYYKLSDIAEILDVEKHVLKYWEDVFGIFKPAKVGRRLNLYSSEDLENFKEIRRLVHGERYTVEGAKMKLAERGLIVLGVGGPSDGKGASP